jgi:hypothetical protein
MTIQAYIIDFLITVLIALFTKVAVPHIKAHVTAKKLETVTTYIDRFVAAAEQKVQESGLGAQKKWLVTKLLDGVGIAVDDTVDALIEAAVKNMNKMLDTAVSAGNADPVEQQQGG